MSPAWIRRRAVNISKRNARGVTYQVLYRRGGRGYAIESAGTFKTDKEARTRRDLVAGWLASGLDPRGELAKLITERQERKTPERWRDDWIASLHHLGDATKNTYRHGVNAVLKALDVDDLHEISVPDCERVVGELAAGYSPKTMSTYWTAFQLLLDYAAVEPNPSRNRRVKLPKIRRVPVNPPTAAHFEAMVGRVAAKYVKPMVFLEQTAVRVETIETLEWQMVDVRGSRIRTIEKGGKPRWVPLPAWLTRQLVDAVGPEDRDGRVFPGITGDALRGAMKKACQAAGIPHYHPHDLRHRRASLWHLQGIPDAVLADRVGHERASFTKDVYVHVMPDVEIPAERLEAMLVEARS